MKKYSKSIVVLVLMFAVSAVGYGIAYGYGGGSSGTVVRPIITPAGGRVLGASTFNFGTVLRQGSNGNAVKELQERLRAEGFFKYPTSTGYFGSVTRDALKAYQRAHKLVPYGILNRATLALLNA